MASRRFWLRCLLVGALAFSATALDVAAQDSRPAAPEAGAPLGSGSIDASPHADGVIFYPLRVGEDPARVARMFGVGVDELLALNGIRDPRRLSVGTVLRIPDPRAERVRVLEAERDDRERRLSEARAEVAALQGRIAELQTRLDQMQRDNGELTRRLTGYALWQAAGIGFAGLAMILGAVWIALRLRAAEAARRADVAVREARELRGAIDRYRQLGGQLELKYQRLYAISASEEAARRARELRRSYEEQVAALDARGAGERTASAPAGGVADAPAHAVRRGKAA